MISHEDTAPQAEEAIRAPRQFPGYDGNWQRKELRPFLLRHFEKVSSDTDLRIYSSSREGLLPQDEYYGGNKLINAGEYGLVPANYFVYRHMSDDTTFKFNINNTGQSIAVSREYPVFKTDGVDPTFLRYLLNESYPFKQFAAMQRKGGTRTRLYFETLCSWHAPLPSLLEQERIGECLASVDSLIETETDKLYMLKHHKQGLMQQLFPADGENLPLLRFQEFSDQPDWVEHKVSDVASIATGGKDTQNKSENGKYPFFVRSQNVERIDSYSLDCEAVLTSGDGVGVGKNFHYIDGKFDFHQRVYCIHDFKPQISGKFFYYIFSRNFFPRVSAMSAKNSVDSVRMAMISEMPILIPSLVEQERVAAILSTVDDLIVAQDQKIQLLTEHKQGLLQELFPVLDEVQG